MVRDVNRPHQCLVVAVNSIGAVGSINPVDAVGEGLLFEALAVKRAAAAPQAFCSLLGRDVALRLSHHLVTDLEFADGSTAKKRRVKMDVEMAALDLLVRAFQRRLVNTHACSFVSHVV